MSQSLPWRFTETSQHCLQFVRRHSERLLSTMTNSSMTKTTELVWCFWLCHSGGTVCSAGERSSTLSKFSIEKAAGVFEMKNCEWPAHAASQTLAVTLWGSLHCIFCNSPWTSVQAADKRKKGRKWVYHGIYYWAGTYHLSSGHDVPIYVWRHHSEIYRLWAKHFYRCEPTSCSPHSLTTGCRIKIKLRKEMQDSKSFIVLMKASEKCEVCFPLLSNTKGKKTFRAVLHGDGLMLRAI